jgi:hypothetical protein
MGIGSWLFKKITNYFNKESKHTNNRSYLCDFDRVCHEIIPGDVLLIEGRNRISNVIKRITHSRWTHAALYIGRLHSIEDPELREHVRQYYHGSASNQLLVETIVGKGTLINATPHYKDYHIRICRPVGLSHSDAQKIIGFAIRHLGHTYDVRHFIDLGRFLLSSRWFIPRLWRSSLFNNIKNQTNKDVCSSMLAEAFTSVNFPVLPLIRSNKDKDMEMIHRNPKLFTPSDFDYSPYFSIIKYPIYPNTHDGPYHHFPWREDLISHDEDVVETKKSK